MVNVGTAKICFLFHEPHGLIAELVGVVDRNDSCLRGKERAGLSSGVDRDASADARSLFHRRLQLRPPCIDRALRVFHRRTSLRPVS